MFLFVRTGSSGGGVIFLETGGKPGSSAAKHAFIEAVPVPRNASLDAPMYFRQVRGLRPLRVDGGHSAIYSGHISVAWA